MASQALLANSYAPFKTLLRCLCLRHRQLLSLCGRAALLFMDDGSCGELPGRLAQGQAHGTQGAFADVQAWT